MTGDSVEGPAHPAWGKDPQMADRPEDPQAGDHIEDRQEEDHPEAHREEGHEADDHLAGHGEEHHLADHQALSPQTYHQGRTSPRAVGDGLCTSGGRSGTWTARRR